jgi:hypothetical protein
MSDVDTQEIEVWHIEHVSFDLATMSWQPHVSVQPSEAVAQGTMAQWRNMKHVACLRLSGPHKHTVPKPA